jgi:hypothetical protein
MIARLAAVLQAALKAWRSRLSRRAAGLGLAAMD